MVLYCTCTAQELQNTPRSVAVQCANSASGHNSACKACRMKIAQLRLCVVISCQRLGSCSRTSVSRREQAVARLACMRHDGKAINVT